MRKRSLWIPKCSAIIFANRHSNEVQLTASKNGEQGIMTKRDPIEELKAALTDKLHIDLRKNPIHLKKEGNAIIIDGVVDGIALKKRALFIAMGLQGVSGVIDRLKVKPSTTMSDAEIKDHLTDTLTGEPTLQSCDIKTEVHDGVVDIEGIVPSLSHKRLAGALAWWIPGTKDVINSLEVAPQEDDSDDEVEDALRIALEKDRLVDASGITVLARNWVVTLSGSVGSDAEKNAAEEDAWYIWGVNDVVNNLVVRPAGAQRVP